MKFPARNNKGYVAVVSAIVITAIVTVIALVFSSSNFLGRLDTQFASDKEEARNLAEGCVEYARLKLTQGSYSGDEIVAIASSTCTLLPLTTVSGGNYQIRSQATVSARAVNLEVVVSSSTLETVSIREAGSF